jgi:hypothetical protein
MTVRPVAVVVSSFTDDVPFWSRMSMLTLRPLAMPLKGVAPAGFGMTYPADWPVSFSVLSSVSHVA